MGPITAFFDKIRSQAQTRVRWAEPAYREDEAEFMTCPAEVAPAAWLPALVENDAFPAVRELVMDLHWLEWTPALWARIPALFPGLERLEVGLQLQPEVLFRLDWPGLRELKLVLTGLHGKQPLAGNLAGLTSFTFTQSELAPTEDEVAPPAWLAALDMDKSFPEVQERVLDEHWMDLNPSMWTRISEQFPGLKRIEVSLPDPAQQEGPGQQALNQAEPEEPGLPATGLNLEDLSQLLLSAGPSLQTVQFERLPDGWTLSAELIRMWRAQGVSLCPAWSIVSWLSPSERVVSAESRQAMRYLLAQGLPISCESLVELIDGREDFVELREVLAARATVLNLNNENGVFDFLFSTPQLLAGFDRLESLYLSDTNLLTSEGIHWLVNELPALKKLDLINNWLMSHLDLKSPTLTQFCLYNFQCLDSLNLDCPQMMDLELRWTGNGLTNPYRDCPGMNMGTLYERLLKDLLDGAPTAQLPRLKKLSLIHHHSGFGQIVTEHERMDIPCHAGHPALEYLCLTGVDHIRNLTLRKLPSLKDLYLTSYFGNWDEDGTEYPDDEDLDGGWIESLDLTDLPDNCQTFVKGCLSKRPHRGVAGPEEWLRLN